MVYTETTPSISVCCIKSDRRQSDWRVSPSPELKIAVSISLIKSTATGRVVTIDGFWVEVGGGERTGDRERSLIGEALRRSVEAKAEAFFMARDRERVMAMTDRRVLT